MASDRPSQRQLITTHHWTLCEDSMNVRRAIHLPSLPLSLEPRRQQSANLHSRHTLPRPQSAATCPHAKSRFDTSLAERDVHDAATTINTLGTAVRLPE